MAMETTTYNITSLYSFSEPAKIEIREKLYKSILATNVRLDHDQDDLFTLTCPKEDKTSFLTFFDLMKNLISSELESQPEVFEDTKVKRMADTQTETSDAQEEIYPAENARQPDQEMNFEAPYGAERSTLLIPHESFSQTWSSKFSELHQGAGLKFNERLLGIIGTLTGCRVELEHDRRTVTVKGEDIEELAKAVSKLDVVDRCTNQQSTCPRKYDFQYSEGELDIMLMMQTLKDVQDRRLQTTLISPEPSLAKKLGSYLTVIMIKEGLEMLVTSSGRPSQASLKQTLLWKDHLFKPHGDEPKVDFTPSSSSVSSTHPARATVGRWIEQSASGVLDNPFSPPDLTKQTLSSGQEVIVPPRIEPPPPPPPVRKRYAKSRKPLGVEVPTVNELPPSAVTNSHEIPDISESEAVSQAVPASFKMAAGSTIGSQSVVVNERNINPPPIEPPFMPRTSLMPTESPLTPTEPPLMLTDLPLIADVPPFMLTESKPSSQGDYQRKGPIWNQKRVEYSPMGKLIDFSFPSPSSDVQDRVQKADEVGTRRLKHTMNQRKSASHFGASKSSFAALMKDFEMATTDILDLARVCQGPVTLRVEIGRILINHMSGSRDFKRKPFAVGDWPKVFPRDGKSRLETLFTNMLTSSPVDAYSILGLVLPSDRPMITAAPAERKITYRFDCTTKSNDRVIVEVEENGNFEASSLNWHFPKRYWDAQLAVNSSERLSNDIRNAAQELIDNLRIRPSSDQKALNIHTKIEKGDLRIKSILLRRETCHHVPEYRDIIFHLSEVQALRLSLPSDSKTIYEASLPPSQPNVSGSWCKIWWEVALSSISATQRLKESDGLELGEEATWTAHDVLRRDVVKDLSYVTRDLVERIDFVGFSNKGPRGGSGTKSSEKDKPPSEDPFW